MCFVKKYTSLFKHVKSTVILLVCFMFLFFIFQYEAAPLVVAVPKATMEVEVSQEAHDPSDSLYGLSLAENAIEDRGVEWGQVALYGLSTLGIWLADGLLSLAVQKMGQFLVRKELEGQAGPWSKFALKVLRICPRWAFTQRDVRRAEETAHHARTFCDTMEEADRIYQERRRMAAEARPVAENANVTIQDQEETFRPRITSTEKKKVIICHKPICFLKMRVKHIMNLPTDMS